MLVILVVLNIKVKKKLVVLNNNKSKKISERKMYLLYFIFTYLAIFRLHDQIT